MPRLSHRPALSVLPWLVIVLSWVSGCDHSPTPAVTQPPPIVLKKPQEGGPEVTRQTLPPPAPDAAAAEAEKAAGTPGQLPPVPAGAARVALLVPLSGRLADIGKGMVNASQMALFDVADDRLQVLTYDTGDSPEGAQAAVKKAIGNGATLILGPLLAASTRAVTPLAKDANVRVLSFSSDRKVGGQGIYVLGFAPETEVERIVGYAADQGARRFSLLAAKDTYGDTVAAALRRIAKDRGLTVVRTELYDPRSKDFGAILDRIRGVAAAPAPAAASPTSPSTTSLGGASAGAPSSGSGGTGSGGTGLGGSAAPARPAAAGFGATGTIPLPTNTSGEAVPGGGGVLPADQPLPFDALLVADGGDRLRLLAGQLAGKGLAPAVVRVLGTGAWDEAALKQDRSLSGAWFAAPEPAFRDEFEQRYRRTFGTSPPRLATLGYDATALAAVLARDRGREGFADDWLTNPEGFFGRDGLFRLVPEGYADRRLAVLQVADGGAVVISEAPRRFTGF